MQITIERTVTHTVTDYIDVPKHILDALDALLDDCRLISAIKLIRGWYADKHEEQVLGLKAAKDWVEAYDMSRVGCQNVGREAVAAKNAGDGLHLDKRGGQGLCTCLS